jgi:hypothetical protein
MCEHGTAQAASIFGVQMYAYLFRKYLPFHVQLIDEENNISTCPNNTYNKFTMLVA